MLHTHSFSWSEVLDNATYLNFFNFIDKVNPEGIIRNAVFVVIAVSVVFGKNRLNAEIAFHIAAKMRFGRPKNLSYTAISSRIGHILNPMVC